MSDDDAPDVWPPHPRTRERLTGHPEAERALLDAYTSGRMHHAWLMTGPRGIGKATLAYRFARFLLSQGGAEAGDSLFGAPPPPESLDIPTDSLVFRRVSAGGHGDLKGVERAVDEKTGKLKSVISVEDVRAVGHFLHMTASEGGWRVVVVDSADDMNPNAANALLKVLEEPPARAMILLVSHNPGRLLPTIRSRCRRLALRPLSEDTVSGLLGEFYPSMTPGDAHVLARLADGSIGRACGLAEEGGLDLFGEVNGLLAGWPTVDIAALHSLGERMGKPGAEKAFDTLGELFLWWLGRLVVKGAGGRITAEQDETALMERLLSQAPLDRWLEVWEKSTRLLGRADSANLERKQVVLNLFLALESAARP